MIRVGDVVRVKKTGTVGRVRELTISPRLPVVVELGVASCNYAYDELDRIAGRVRYVSDYFGQTVERATCSECDWGVQSTTPGQAHSMVRVHIAARHL